MRVATMLGVLAAIFLVASPTVGFNPQSNGDSLPTISELESLNFKSVDIAPTSNSNPNNEYTEISNLRSTFLAYSAGSEAVSKYRDPVLTRGIPGISVFRTVSSAVVVVVVGNIKNNEFDPEGMGTGAIVDPKGYVLTNWHVIKGHPAAVLFLKPTNSSELSNAEAFVGRVIYQDPTVDLALLKMDKQPSNLHSIAVGDIAQVQIAEDIHIIGHPHGNLWSYSTGVVSQIRDGYSWTYEDGSKHLAKVLQLQTAINPGNSGGPVVDDGGKILGLVAMSEEGQNLDYAIASDVIKRFLFTGMQMNTRGITVTPAPSKPPRQLFFAKLGDLEVEKAVYDDATLYSIEDHKGPRIVAKFKDGTIIKGWEEGQSGERSWSSKLPNGKEFVAVTSNGSVVRISGKT